PRSVVYVALGSEAPVSVELLRELALGLDLSGAPFLWALRKPRGDGGDDVLPPGFEERTRGRGLVETGWVPQIKILAHAAVGAFLTHCGSRPSSWTSKAGGCSPPTPRSCRRSSPTPAATTGASTLSFSS
uniref:Uncharacterized protein n=1 Tax=Oryza brachyantha TaxID=4533 RepID=J3LDM8_ORYBR